MSGAFSMTIVMFIAFFALIFLSVPIGWALGISAVFSMVVTNGGNFSLILLASRVYNSTNSFVLMALPFFILAGNIMSVGGLSRRLINFCRALIGCLRGGLGMTGIFAAFFFSAISGSNAATTAAVGGMMIPELEENGYPRELSAAVIASAGTTGMVIPPSSAMVVYAAAASAYSVSLPALFMAGLVPGIMMSVTMMLCTYFIARHMNIPKDKWGGWRNVAKAFVQAIGALMMPIIILGGIYSGIFTATEAAVVACVYALLYTLISRELHFKDLPKIFWESAITSAVGMIVITCASMLSYVLTREHIPEALSNLFLSWTNSPLIIMLLINIVLLIAGCFMTPNSAIVILVPIFLPLCASFGINPVALGIIMVINLSIGAITPPVGGNVFIASSIAATNVEKIFKRVLPYLMVLLADLVVLNLFDEIILFLPRLLGEL